MQSCKSCKLYRGDVRGSWPVFQQVLKGMEEVENEQVWSDSEVSCEEWSEGEVKEGEEDCKDNSSDTANGQDGCKDNASDKSQTSDLGVIVIVGEIRKQLLVSFIG